MVEIEVRKAKTPTKETQTTTIDINEIINRVREFINSFKSMPNSSQLLDFKVETFNFSISKTGEEYELTVKANLAFKFLR